MEKNPRLTPYQQLVYLQFIAEFRESGTNAEVPESVALYWYCAGWADGLEHEAENLPAQTFVAGISEAPRRKWSDAQRAKFKATMRRRRNGKKKHAR